MTGTTETELARTQTRRRPLSWRKWLAAALLLAAVYAGRHYILRQIGSFLVQADEPQHADIAVVLAGDGYGHRILKAAELARQGYIKQVLVDGPRGMYGFNESALAIHYAVDQGAPKEIFSSLVMKARSTMAESQDVDAELRRRNVHKALVVTSNYHTRRARSVFRRFGSRDIQYVFVAAPDEDFAPEDWWHSRDAEKVVFLEYAKLFDWWLIEGRP